MATIKKMDKLNDLLQFSSFNGLLSPGTTALYYPIIGNSIYELSCSGKDFSLFCVYHFIQADLTLSAIVLPNRKLKY